MFRIGEFSRIARVSCRLLRYYEQLGLIAPVRTDAATGYRYYSAKQLPQLNRILVLRELGLSLDQIGRMLGERTPPAELRGMLLMRRAEIEQSIAAESARLRQVESRIALIEAEGELVADDVLVRAEPARRVLSLRRTLPSFADAMQLAGTLAEAVPRHAAARDLGHFFAIDHGSEFEPESVDVEFGFFVAAARSAPLRLPGGDELAARDVPAVEHLATCVRVGSPQDAHLMTARIARFVESSGYRLAGANREVFLQRPRADRMQDAVIEMQFPVEPLAGAALSG